jgi:hypothetical protein
LLRSRYGVVDEQELNQKLDDSFPGRPGIPGDSCGPDPIAEDPVFLHLLAEERHWFVSIECFLYRWRR